MRTLLTIILAVLFHSTIFGVGNPDRIIYNGKEYELLQIIRFPMEGYFAKYPEKRRSPNVLCSRGGFVTTFELINNQLYINELKEFVRDNTNERKLKSVFNELFPDQESVKADWITDNFLFPYGNKKFGSRYEQYIFLIIENGNLIVEKRLNHIEYRKLRRVNFLRPI